MLVGIDRCNTSPAQSGAAGESAAAGGPKCIKLRVKLRTVAVGANCEGLHSSKSHKSNCSPVEVLFNEESSSVHENLWDKLPLSVVLPHTYGLTVMEDQAAFGQSFRRERSKVWDVFKKIKLRTGRWKPSARCARRRCLTMERRHRIYASTWSGTKK